MWPVSALKNYATRVFVRVELEVEVRDTFRVADDVKVRLRELEERCVPVEEREAVVVLVRVRVLVLLRMQVPAVQAPDS